jgi:hypothetical protein
MQSSGFSSRFSRSCDALLHWSPTVSRFSGKAQLAWRPLSECVVSGFQGLFVAPQSIDAYANRDKYVARGPQMPTRLCKNVDLATCLHFSSTSLLPRPSWHVMRLNCVGRVRVHCLLHAHCSHCFSLPLFSSPPSSSRFMTLDNPSPHHFFNLDRAHQPASPRI